MLGYPPASRESPQQPPPQHTPALLWVNTRSCPTCALERKKKPPQKRASLSSCCAKLLPFTSVKSTRSRTAEKQINSLNHLHYTSHTEPHSTEQPCTNPLPISSCTSAGLHRPFGLEKGLHSPHSHPRSLTGSTYLRWTPREHSCSIC